MDVAFAGTPEFAATILGGIMESNHEVGLVISRPDVRQGRGRRAKPPAVASLARDAGLALVQPENISSVARDIARYDALVVAAYGQILRPDTLYAATTGAWNVHASLLPAYRGAAPIERALMNGDRKTGVSIMRMNEGLDTGPVALRKSMPVPPEMNAGELTAELARLGAEAIVEVLVAIERGEVVLEEQEESCATYAAKLSGEDLAIRWDRPASEVHDRIRALAPRPGARAYHPEFEGPIKILGSRLVDIRGPFAAREERPGSITVADGQILVRCGVGEIEVERLQLPGGKPLAAADFLRGNALAGHFLG